MKYPPFCPNPDCDRHLLSHRDTTWYSPSGYYRTHTHGTVKRFRCNSCGFRFSAQTFSLDYFVKKKLPYRYIFNQLKSAAGIRDIARDLKVSPGAVLNRISRMSRQAVGIHCGLCRSVRLNEDLVADGFESFTVSQYYPNNIHLLAGKESQYLYAFDYSYLARKGRMTEYQKKLNRIKKESSHGGISVTESFSNICSKIDILMDRRRGNHTVLYTDQKPQYKRVIAQAHFYSSLSHITISSRLPRTVTNKLFSVNYLDREIRKDNANHVRESVQFSRNTGNCMERMALYSLYHNYMKPYRIRSGTDTVHAEIAGISGKKINAELKSLFTERRFLSRMKGMSMSDIRTWFGLYTTPGSTSWRYIPDYAKA